MPDKRDGRANHDEEFVRVPVSVIEALLGTPNNRDVVAQIREIAEDQLSHRFKTHRKIPDAQGEGSK